jgi:hypothetical protein
VTGRQAFPPDRLVEIELLEDTVVGVEAAKVGLFRERKDEGVIRLTDLNGEGLRFRAASRGPRAPSPASPG